MSIIKRAAHYFAQKEYCRKAICERADLYVFKEKLSFAVKMGIVLVLFSYVIGLPAVIAMGALAAILKEPLVFIVGGPLIYGISTLIFIMGVYLAGTKYIKAFFRWLTRTILEKILGDEVKKYNEVLNE